MAQEGGLPSAAEARVQTAGRTLEADQKIGEAAVELLVADADVTDRACDRNASILPPPSAPAGTRAAGPTKDGGLLRFEATGGTPRAELGPDDYADGGHEMCAPGLAFGIPDRDLSLAIGGAAGGRFPSRRRLISTQARAPPIVACGPGLPSTLQRRGWACKRCLGGSGAAFRPP